MRPEGSEYCNEVSLNEAAQHYLDGETVLIRFYDKDWYAVVTQNKNRKFLSNLEDVTLDMLPHARYFIKEN